MVDINPKCLKDNAFPEGITSCDECEFLTQDTVSCIGGMAGMSMGTRDRCEKGYWREEV